MQVMRYGNYTGTVDCLVPVLGVQSFDNWITTSAEEWFQRSRAHLDSVELTVDVPGPDMRWSLHASSWVDLTLLTDEVVSGIMTGYDLRSHAYRRRAFSFDLKNGRHLPTNELARRPNLDAQLIADATMALEDDSEDAQYRSWRENSPPAHIALSSHGFVLFTDFDPMHGDRFVRLPYVKYATELKRNAFVLDLAQD
jgi:hypothetical protein